jgi:threonine dehydrogenase-like Zn-dependent dehydrogenase
VGCMRSDRADPKLDDVMVIAGIGPVGLCMLQVAKLRHLKLLIALDTKEERLISSEKPRSGPNDKRCRTRSRSDEIS